jgi:hypothetical protein
MKYTFRRRQLLLTFKGSEPNGSKHNRDKLCCRNIVHESNYQAKSTYETNFSCRNKPP